MYKKPSNTPTKKSLRPIRGHFTLKYLKNNFFLRSEICILGTLLWASLRRKNFLSWHVSMILQKNFNFVVEAVTLSLNLRGYQRGGREPWDFNPVYLDVTTIEVDNRLSLWSCGRWVMLLGYDESVQPHRTLRPTGVQLIQTPFKLARCRRMTQTWFTVKTDWLNFAFTLRINISETPEFGNIRNSKNRTFKSFVFIEIDVNVRIQWGSE